MVHNLQGKLNKGTRRHITRTTAVFTKGENFIYFERASLQISVHMSFLFNINSCPVTFSMNQCVLCRKIWNHGGINFLPKLQIKLMPELFIRFLTSFLLFFPASGVAPGQFSPSVMSQQQLQQQQLIFNVNQCYSQLMYQQHELTELRRRIEQVRTDAICT